MMWRRAGRHVCGIGGHVDGGFAVFGDGLATRVGPDHGRDAFGGGFAAHVLDLFHHVHGQIGTGVDREPDRGTAKAQRVIDRCGDGLIFARTFAHERVGGVHFEDGGDLTAERIRARLKWTKRGGVGGHAPRRWPIGSGNGGRSPAGLPAKDRAGPCSNPWSTGRMMSLPVPPSLPSIKIRARFAFTPGVSPS